MENLSQKMVQEVLSAVQAQLNENLKSIKEGLHIQFQSEEEIIDHFSDVFLSEDDKLQNFLVAESIEIEVSEITDINSIRDAQNNAIRECVDECLKYLN